MWRLLLSTFSATAIASHAVLPAGSTWANLAWGFSGGGRDSTSGVQMVLVDPDAVSARDVAAFRARGQTVVCYLSAGTIEKRRADYVENRAAWDAVLLGKMADWDETWIDIRRLDAVLPLVTKRLDKLAAKGCQGVEPDNIDCYDNADCWQHMSGVSSGNAVQAAEVTYCKALAAASHDRNMSILIKNAAAIVPKLASVFDGAITENCVANDECGTYKTHLVDAGKAHFATEYSGNVGNCAKAYPKMSMKYCDAQSGANLCKDSRVHLRREQ
uniref:Secreted protein n=1 Tax=Achlya hypogyna TaxID=1202772 RepID=A0A0A7CNC7_ACHHY|nr:secreted protein [Achlya hypogyna]